MNPFRVFLEVVLAFSDLRWNQFRDDLVVQAMKVLRKFRDGSGLEEIRAQGKFSREIDPVLELLYSFASQSSPEEVNRLIDALSLFAKAPAPCKTKMIGLIETILGKVGTGESGK
jgi:hypothetical protein